MLTTDWETILNVAMICWNRARKIEGLNCAQTIMSTQLRQTSRGILWWVRKLYHGINRILHDLSFWMDIFLSRKQVLLLKHFNIWKSQMGLKSIQNKVSYEFILWHNANTLPSKYAKFNLTKWLNVYYSRNSSAWTKVIQIISQRMYYNKCCK